MKAPICPSCSKEFIPFRPLQKVCGKLACAAKYARQLRAKKEAREKANLKARKAALKRIPDLLKDAQHAFNAFIRERDKQQSCICCGLPWGTNDFGGAYDAGHYRSVGSAPHLRFDEANVHGQRKHCNRYGAGRAVDYRIGLIGRIGLERVERIESDNRVHKWTRDELIQIAATYKAKLKELKCNDADS